MITICVDELHFNFLLSKVGSFVNVHLDIIASSSEGGMESTTSAIWWLSWC